MRESLRKADTLANAQRQIRAKASTMADCARADATTVYARADAMTVHARADAMVVRGIARGVLRRENLQRGIFDGGSATGDLRKGNVLRTIDGRRSNVGLDCSKTNF